MVAECRGRGRRASNRRGFFPQRNATVMGNGSGGLDLGDRSRQSGRITNHAPEHLAALKERKKRIVICADGTWENRPSGSRGASAASNVWLWYQLVEPEASDGVAQLAYYHPGVGTGNWLDHLWGGMTGQGLDRNIVECYRFIVDHYVPGDALYLFGFSRGAYTVRSLAGLIRSAGIIARVGSSAGVADRVDAAYRMYRGRASDTVPFANRAVDFRRRYSHPDCQITCIGVWDTVGALGIPRAVSHRLLWPRRYDFHDVTLSSWVQRAFHAVAIDEHRPPFVSTLWEQQLGARDRGQILEQVWFSGAHADVGGGYPAAERALATTTLQWMVDRVTATCRLEFEPKRLEELRRLSQAPPMLHDSMSLLYRIIDVFRKGFAPGAPGVTRCIDGELGETGCRDPLAVRRESVDPSVLALQRDYVAKPIPAVNRPYDPPNLANYEARLARTAQCPPAPPPSDDDTRPVVESGRPELRSFSTSGIGDRHPV